MKVIPLLFIMLLLTSMVIATVIPGDTYTVTIIPICESPIEVKIRGNEDSIKMNDFLFEQCEPINIEEWICRCNKGSSFPLILHTTENVENVYDITVQYYLKDKEYLDNISVIDDGYSIRHANTRTINFNNLEVKYAPSVVEKKSKSYFNSSDGFIIVIIILCILLLFVGIIIGIYFMIRNLFKNDDKNDIKKSDEDMDKKVKELIEKL